MSRAKVKCNRIGKRKQSTEKKLIKRRKCENAIIKYIHSNPITDYIRLLVMLFFLAYYIKVLKDKLSLHIQFKGFVKITLLRVSSIWNQELSDGCRAIWSL